jgi:hypothetical protein
VAVGPVRVNGLATINANEEGSVPNLRWCTIAIRRVLSWEYEWPKRQEQIDAKHMSVRTAEGHVANFLTANCKEPNAACDKALHLSVAIAEKSPKSRYSYV